MRLQRKHKITASIRVSRAERGKGELRFGPII